MATPKFHITPAGPRPCTATERACVYGEAHFSSLAEAEVTFKQTYNLSVLPSGERRSREEKLLPVELTGQVRYSRGFHGVKLPSEPLEPLVSTWRETVGLPALAMEEHLQSVRGNSYHMTVIGPREKGAKSYLEARPLAITTGGIGRVTADEDEEAWFILCTSPEAQAYRAEVGLPPKDLHITLGFKNKDIHGVPKDASTLVII